MIGPSVPRAKPLNQYLLRLPRRVSKTVGMSSGSSHRGITFYAILVNHLSRARQTRDGDGGAASGSHRRAAAHDMRFAARRDVDEGHACAAVLLARNARGARAPAASPGTGRCRGRSPQGLLHAKRRAIKSGPSDAHVAPVDYSDDARARRVRQRQPLDRPRQRGGMDGMARCTSSRAAGSPPSGLAGLSLRHGEAVGALGMAGEQLRESLGEGAARASRLAAVEALDRQLQPDRLSAGRQIGSPSPITAVDRRTAGSARRAAGVIVPCSGEPPRDFRRLQLFSGGRTVARPPR